MITTDRPALQRSRRLGMLPLLLLMLTACALQGRPDGSSADSYETRAADARGAILLDGSDSRFGHPVGTCPGARRARSGS